MTYITNTASAMRIVKFRIASRNVRASPWNSARSWDGTVSRTASSTNATARPIGTPGMRLKLIVTLVNWFKWFTDCGPTVGSQVARAESGTSAWPSSLRT